MEIYDKHPYAFFAFEISLAAGVIGLLWSIASVIIRVRRGKAAVAAGDEAPSVTWNPLQYVITFAVLWPALVPLGPIFFLAERRKDPKAKEVALAEAMETGVAPPVSTADKVLYGAAGTIMLLYIVGFFIFD
jgi:hypothetical protein